MIVVVVSAEGRRRMNSLEKVMMIEKDKKMEWLEKMKN